MKKKLKFIILGLMVIGVQLQAGEVDDEINKILQGSQTNESRSLSNYFKGKVFKLPEKMSRKDIKKAPIFFKNSIYNYLLISMYLVDKTKKKIEKVNNKKVQIDIRDQNNQRTMNDVFDEETYDKYYSSLNNRYLKIKECEDNIFSIYYMELHFLNDALISTLSKEKQNKLYLVTNAKELALKKYINVCITYFNEADNIFYKFRYYIR